MGAAIGQILPLAVGVALSPVPIIAVALMLRLARLDGPAQRGHYGCICLIIGAKLIGDAIGGFSS